MTHPARWSIPALFIATTVAAQGAAIKLADVAGTWEGKHLLGGSAGSFASWTMVATADPKGWTLTFPGRGTFPVRILATGGDSIVMEVGPYPSLLRPGHTVTMHSVGHVHGDTMTGTGIGHIDTGDVVPVTLEAKRRR